MKKILFIFIFLNIINLYACKPESTVSLKVMSYNIRHGEGMDKILDLSRSAKIIKSIAPDLCGLQEIDNFCLRSNKVGQTEYLAQKTFTTGTFAKFMDYQEGEYGMATLTAKPIISTKIVQLPDGKYEPRTSIVQEIQIAEKCTITFANVHFDWISEKEGSINRLNQAKTLVKYINTLNNAVIITGDFNCTPNSPTMQYFAKQGFVFVQKGDDNLSFQGEDKKEIDHLIYRNTNKVKFKKNHTQLMEEPIVSDHRPLITELEVIF